MVAAPGLIPDEAFFALLSQRRFPVPGWIRKPEEFDYVVEPDVFHDLFGHVPLLFNRMFADYMQAYGAGGLKASSLELHDRQLPGELLHDGLRSASFSRPRPRTLPGPSLVARQGRPPNWGTALE